MGHRDLRLPRAGHHPDYCTLSGSRPLIGGGPLPPAAASTTQCSTCPRARPQPILLPTSSSRAVLRHGRRRSERRRAGGRGAEAGALGGSSARYGGGSARRGRPGGPSLARSAARRPTYFFLGQSGRGGGGEGWTAQWSVWPACASPPSGALGVASSPTHRGVSRRPSAPAWLPLWRVTPSWLRSAFCLLHPPLIRQGRQSPPPPPPLSTPPPRRRQGGRDGVARPPPSLSTSAAAVAPITAVAATPVTDGDGRVGTLPILSSTLETTRRLRCASQGVPSRDPPGSTPGQVA